MPSAKTAPWKDAWAKPWHYELVGFEKVAGFDDQKYKLESVSIPPPSDLATALALPYGQALQIQAKPMDGSGTGSPVIQIKFLEGPKKGKLAMGQAGSDVDGLSIAHASRGLVIVCDTLHWKLIKGTR